MTEGFFSNLRPEPKPQVFTDTSGNQLVEYGILTSESNRLIFVCFDNHSRLGRHLHVMRTRFVQDLMREKLKHEQPRYGSKDFGVRRTGAGLLFSPQEADAKSYPFEEESDAGSLSQRGIRVVKRWLRTNGYTFRDATSAEQMEQIDLVARKRVLVKGKPVTRILRIEVKTRSEGKTYDRLFMQTHESNPDCEYGQTVRPRSRVITVQRNFAHDKEKWEDCNLTTAFATGIIDPDWPYTVAPGRERIADANGKGRLSGFTRNRDTSQNQYLQQEAMSIDALKKLPIDRLIGGYLFLWTVGPFLINGSASAIMRAWGFRPVSILTWAKYNLSKNHGYGGVGYWFLGNAEFCLVGKREGWPSIRTGRSSLIIKPKQEHSEKPDDIHQLCEERFPSPYVELFGRRRRQGWTVLGNEAPDDGLDITRSIQRFI